MDFFLIIVSIIGIILLYFLFGAIVKFILGWLPLCIGTIISLFIGIWGGGVVNAIIGIVLFLVSLLITNSWQGSRCYLNIEEKLDSMFYFKD
jgi:hypothetical protein